MNLSSQQTVQWLTKCAEIFALEQDNLTELDRAIGDGDHGLNMHRGFQKVAEKLPSVADKNIAIILKTTGMTLLSSVGGASGPLFGTFFIKAAQAAADKPYLTLADLAEIITAGTEGVAMRGKAEPGDKTMCDVWWPVSESLSISATQNLSLDQALKEAIIAARLALEATVPMQARKGRASYLGERSIGHQDPGATSVLLMMDTLQQIVSASSASSVN